MNKSFFDRLRQDNPTLKVSGVIQRIGPYVSSSMHGGIQFLIRGDTNVYLLLDDRAFRADYPAGLSEKGDVVHFELKANQAGSKVVLLSKFRNETLDAFTRGYLTSSPM